MGGTAASAADPRPPQISPVEGLKRGAAGGGAGGRRTPVGGGASVGVRVFAVSVPVALAAAWYYWAAALAAGALDVPRHCGGGASDP